METTGGTIEKTYGGFEVALVAMRAGKRAHRLSWEREMYVGGVITPVGVGVLYQLAGGHISAWCPNAGDVMALDWQVIDV